MILTAKKNERCFVCGLIRPIVGNDRWCAYTVCVDCAPFNIVASKVLEFIPGLCHPAPGQFLDK